MCIFMWMKVVTQELTSLMRINRYFIVVYFSSRVNLDIIATSYLDKINKRLKTKRLHAVELNHAQIASIIPDIITVHKKYGLNFDFYEVVKKDHVLISFFETFFDSAANPAVPKDVYWSPERYVLLLDLYA